MNYFGSMVEGTWPCLVPFGLPQAKRINLIREFFSNVFYTFLIGENICIFNFNVREKILQNSSKLYSKFYKYILKIKFSFIHHSVGVYKY